MKIVLRPGSVSVFRKHKGVVSLFVRYRRPLRVQTRAGYMRELRWFEAQESDPWRFD